MRGRGNFRPMPADFMEHAGESLRELIGRYHAGQEVVTRWKMLSGTWRPRERAVIRTDWEGNEKRFPSVTAAAKATLYATPGDICGAIRRGGTSRGYAWRYAEYDRAFF